MWLAYPSVCFTISTNYPREPLNKSEDGDNHAHATPFIPEYELLYRYSEGY